MKSNLRNLSAYDLGSVSKVDKSIKGAATTQPRLPNREGAYNLNSKNSYPKLDPPKK